MSIRLPFQPGLSTNMYIGRVLSETMLADYVAGPSLTNTGTSWLGTTAALLDLTVPDSHVVILEDGTNYLNVLPVLTSVASASTWATRPIIAVQTIDRNGIVTPRTNVLGSSSVQFSGTIVATGPTTASVAPTAYGQYRFDTEGDQKAVINVLTPGSGNDGYTPVLYVKPT